MKKELLTLLLLFFTLLQAKGADGDSLLLSRQQNFERFAQAFPQERVYVHFDNTSYYKGENIWYKAYVVRDDNMHRTNLSRILYVELLNPVGYPVETQKLVIEDGQAHGSFQLKDTLNAGFYEVRAYTTWMLNFTTGDPHGWRRLYSTSSKRRYGDRFQRYLQGNAGIFSRVFPVYEKVDSGQYAKRRMPQQTKATATMITPEKDRLLIDFYPEGGNLVRDVPTRIAFQAHTTEGRTLNVAGALLRRGDSIGYFKSEYAGRGMFSVTPDSLDAEDLAEGLVLKLTYGKRDYRFPLPKPKKRGYTLGVYPSGSQVRVLVERNERTKGQRLGLNVASRGETSYYGTLDLQQDLQASVMIDNQALQTGVNIVTLFTAEGKVLAQRQFFVDNHDCGGFRLKRVESGENRGEWRVERGERLDGRGEGIGDGDLQPYEKVSLDYQLVDTEGRPVAAAHDFSIAVTDGGTREETYDDMNPLIYLLLSSEVKGFIPHPAYYFEADDAEHRGALDLLMMVQGWTRYDYEQMMSGEPFDPMLPIERGLTFAGRIWDDNDYASRRFWKPQGKKRFWVYSELSFTGDVMNPERGSDAFDLPNFEVRKNDQSMCFQTGNVQIDSTGFFRFNLQPFYGMGRLAMVLNKQSIEEMGIEKGGIAAHNFRWNTVKRPLFLLGKRIEPLNQYSPLPRNYDYYETAALTDPIDRDMFRYGFMAVPKGNQGRLAYYDSESETYVLPDVKKNRRRRWSDFSDVKPVCVMDVKDMMAWLSNIYGDIQDFKFRESNPYAGGGNQYAGGHMTTDRSDDSFFHSHDSFITDMMMEDARWLDAQFGTTEYTRQMEVSIQQMRNSYDIETDMPYYARLTELLYIFGLDGMNTTYIDAFDKGGMAHFTTATGDSTLLPANLHFFPINENFQTLRLYADVDNRRLMHRPGHYHETVFGYEQHRTTNNDHPLTSIFNFVTGHTYSNSYPLPEFLGYRINFQGFSQPAEFFCPDYEWEPEPEDTDYRRTVYWNPSASTDAQGRTHIEFYNNGFSKHLTVSAEGITADGQAIFSQDEKK